MSRPGQVKVRGTCKDGHVTETTSAPGRVTWQGECAHAGCELKVHAKRIPRERQQQAANSGPAKSPAQSTTPEVREVSYDVPHPKRQQHEATRQRTDTGEREPEREREPAGGPVQPAPGDGGASHGQQPGAQPPEQPGSDSGADLVGARRERPKRRRGIRNPFRGLRFESPLDR